MRRSSHHEVGESPRLFHWPQRLNDPQAPSHLSNTLDANSKHYAAVSRVPPRVSPSSTPLLEQSEVDEVVLGDLDGGHEAESSVQSNARCRRWHKLRERPAACGFAVASRHRG